MKCKTLDCSFNPFQFGSLGCAHHTALGPKSPDKIGLSWPVPSVENTYPHTCGPIGEAPFVILLIWACKQLRKLLSHTLPPPPPDILCCYTELWQKLGAVLAFTQRLGMKTSFYSHCHNSVPVDRKKLNKTVKKNCWFSFKKIHMFTTASRNTSLSNPTSRRGIVCTKLKICTTICTPAPVRDSDCTKKFNKGFRKSLDMAFLPFWKFKNIFTNNKVTALWKSVKQGKWKKHTS